MKLWVPTRPIEFADLFGGRLARHVIRERRTKHTTDFARMLTDGKNFAWTFGHPNGLFIGIDRQNRIAGSIAHEFGVTFAREDEPELSDAPFVREWDRRANV